MKEIYLEARSVLNISLKCSCVLLRLALEMLIDELDVNGRTLNDKINNYCDDYESDNRLIKAFNLVRITGNEVVHQEHWIVVIMNIL